MATLHYRTSNGNDGQHSYGSLGIRGSHKSVDRSHSNGRPTSAGATRPRSGSFGYGRSNTGVTNLHTGHPVTSSGLSGHGYGSVKERPSSGSGTKDRPSSAGRSRSGSGSSSHHNYHHSNHSGPGHSSHHHHSSGHSGHGHSSGHGGSSSGYARPKSAGAVRRGTDNSSSNFYNKDHASGQYPQYTRHGSRPSNVTQEPPAPTPLNHFAAAMASRPLSANATAATSNAQQYAAAAGPAEHWSTTYKIHYAYNNGGDENEKLAASQPMPQPNTTPQMVGYGASTNGGRPQSASSTASKLRDAVDLSHKLQAAEGDQAVDTASINGTSTTGMSTVGLSAGKGVSNIMDKAIGDIPTTNSVNGAIIASTTVTPVGRKSTITKEEDEEMDGKPVTMESRSQPTHPEVSMTTPSASLDLGQSGSVGLNGPSTDARNNGSWDSVTEDQISISIPTVPNQFCTKRDALELKKLLLLSAGTRGGIVPSSSAVMDMYMVGKVVGVGSYGKVRAAWHRLTALKVAIKTYDKSKLKDPAHWKRVHSEIKIMEQISHPRIARMYEAVETPKRMHLIMECLDGGNLCSYVKSKRRLSEDESKRIFFQIAQAMEYLHSVGVSHRDVKLENVLFANDKDIKIIDFGFSTVCQPGKKLKVFCGTPSYMAPEIVRRSEYEGKPVDIWSMGILLYALLCGCFPFRAKAYPDLYRRIARGTFPIPEELSAPVKDLLRQLLTVDAEARITAPMILRHPWLQSQLINAPNMDKMRLETTILISDKPSDDLDEQVLTDMDKFGLQRDEVVRLILTKTHSSVATLYYLLLDHVVKRRKSAAKKAGNHGLGGNTSSARVKQKEVTPSQPTIVVLEPEGSDPKKTVQNQKELTVQQKVAEQMAQQHLLERQEYRLRAKTSNTEAIAGAGTSTSSNGFHNHTRPNSAAIAGRR